MAKNSTFNKPNNSGISAPCKDCSDRSLTCDKTCEKYLKYRKDIERLRINERQAKLERDERYYYEVKATEKNYN